MKNLFMLGLLFLASCGSKTNPSKEPANITEKVQSENFVQTKSLKRQIIHVQDTQLEVTTAEVKTPNEEKYFIFLVKSPTQIFTFKVDGKTHEASEGLSAPHLRSLNEYRGQSATIDLKIDQRKSTYAMMNTLGLDRCRTAQVMPELMKIFTAKRRDLFLAVSIESWRMPVHMLKWNTESKKIVGLVPTYLDQNGSVENIEGKTPLLSPNQNVLDENGQLYTSNMFLEPFNLSLRCHLIYERLAFQTEEFKHLAGLRYQPFWQKELDDIARWSVDARIPTVRSALGLAMAIDEEPADLSEEVIEYVQSHPLFQILSAE